MQFAPVQEVTTEHASQRKIYFFLLSHFHFSWQIPSQLQNTKKDVYFSTPCWQVKHIFVIIQTCSLSQMWRIKNYWVLDKISASGVFQKSRNIFRKVHWGPFPCSRPGSRHSHNWLDKPNLIFFSTECSSKGGTSSGTCASGFGVCCVCKYCPTG